MGIRILLVLAVFLNLAATSIIIRPTSQRIPLNLRPSRIAYSNTDTVDISEVSSEEKSSPVVSDVSKRAFRKVINWLIPSKAVLVHSGTSMINFSLSDIAAQLLLRRGGFKQDFLSLYRIFRFGAYGLLFYGPAGIRVRKAIVNVVSDTGASGAIKKVSYLIYMSLATTIVISF